MTPITIELFCAMLSAGPPMVHYTTKAVTQSWEPISIKQVEKNIEGAALKKLTASGGMRLKKTGFSDLRKGEYSLIINGRFIEEAERFSVYLSFGSGTREDLPSFRASDTSGPLGRKSRSKMQKMIIQTAERAAARLAKVLGPQLDSVRLRVERPKLERPEMPFEWGTIDVPEVRGKNKAIRTLLNVRNPDHERHKALAKIKGFVFDQQAARNAVEHCLLRDPSPDIRSNCASALEAKARNHVPTQRVILHAMRTEVDERVITRLAKISATFVGLSRMETIATWLHIVADEASSARAVGEIAKLLGKEGDVPNLDFAVAACLHQDVLVYGRRGPCADHLLQNLPPERLKAVVWRFLENGSDYGAERSLFEDVVKRAVSKRYNRKNKPDPAYGELLLKVAERRSAGKGTRRIALYEGRKLFPKNLATIERLLKLAWEQPMLQPSVSTAIDLTRKDPKLQTATLGALKKIREKGQFYPRPHRSNPYEILDKAIARLERAAKRRK